MASTPLKLSVPLHLDDGGTYRVSKTRVTLDTIIGCYHQGDAPEKIHDNFPVVSVDDIYAIIAYYLANREELDEHLKQREIQAEEIRQKLESIKTPEQKAHDEKMRRLAEAKRSEKDSE